MQRYNKIFEFPNFWGTFFCFFHERKKGKVKKESFQLKKTFCNRNFSFVRKRKIIYKKKKNHKPLRFAVAIFFYTRTMVRVEFIYPLPGVWERRIDFFRTFEHLPCVMFLYLRTSALACPSSAPLSKANSLVATATLCSPCYKFARTFYKKTSYTCYTTFILTTVSKLP